MRCIFGSRIVCRLGRWSLALLAFNVQAGDLDYPPPYVNLNLNVNVSPAVMSSSLRLPQQVTVPMFESDHSPSSNLSSAPLSTQEVILQALAYLGAPYRPGGNSPDQGFDCSGLVGRVFQEARGMILPRRANEISRLGTAVRQEALQPGDLVFFNTLRRAFSHVGIYLGNQRFIHAPTTGGQVRVETLNTDYWRRHYEGARRLEDPADKTL